MALTPEEIKRYNMIAGIETDVQIKGEMISPEAKTAFERTTTEITKDGQTLEYIEKDKCPEIMLKDIRLGNLNDLEVMIVTEGIGLLHLLRYLTENSNLDLSNAYRYFYNDVISPFHVSNSREGFLEQLMVTRKIETKQEQELKTIEATEAKKGGFSFFKKKDK